ncbi:hypothetical protein BDZ97DRAFT_1916885 [Flammula alnicola]|nr:hypothetical protein BDZ97DRAFT_1916885 [Flammula alnicola]
MSRNRSHRNSSDFRVRNKAPRFRTSARNDAVQNTSQVQDTSQGHVTHQWHQCDENTTSEHVSYGYQSQTVAPHTYPWRQPLIHPNAETLRQPGAYYPGEYYSSVPPALPPQLTNTLDPPYHVNDAVNVSQLGAPYGDQFIYRAPGYASHPNHLNARLQLAPVQNHIFTAPPEYDPHHPYISRATTFQDSVPPKPGGLSFSHPTQTGDYGYNSDVFDCPDTPASTASSGCSQDMNFRTNVKPETTMLVDCLLLDLSTATGDIRMRVNRLLRRDLKTMEDARLTAQAMGCMIDKIGRSSTPFPATFKNKMRKIIKEAVVKLFDEYWQTSDAEVAPVEGSSTPPADSVSQPDVKPMVVASFIGRLFPTRILKVKDVQHCLQVLVDRPATLIQLSATHAMLKHANYRLCKPKSWPETSRLYRKLKNDVDNLQKENPASETDDETQLAQDILEWLRYLKLDADLKNL